MGWTLVGHWRLPGRFDRLHLAQDDVTGLPSHWRRKFIPKLWYFLVNAGAVFFLPFLSLYWRNSLGYSTRQIGLLQALRPWVSAASGNLLSPLADAWNWHFAMLLATYALTITSRGMLTLQWSYGLTLFWALVMEGAVSPMGILVDASVVAGSTKDGTYGRARLWASVGWGGFAPVAGAIMGKFGIHTCFMVFAGIYASAFVPTLLIPAGLLGTKYSRLRKGSSASGSGGGSDAAAVPGSHISVDETVPAEGAPAPAVGQSAADVAVDGADAGGAEQEQQQSTHSALSTANRRRSRRSEAHMPGQPARRSTAHSDSSRRQSGVHIVADARGGGQGSRGDEVIVDITIRPASAKGAAAGCYAGDDKAAAGKEQSGEADDASEGGAAADQESLWRALRTFLADVYVLTFMFKAFLMGVANGFIGYLFLLLSDQGANGTLLGLCLTVNCLAEVPVFYYSGALIKRLSVELALNLALGAYCVRLVAYALLPYYSSVWAVLPVELLQGMTFALAWSAGTVHCRRIAPRRLRSTVQSIFSGLYTGVGAGVGGLAGGLLYEAFDGQIMCEIAAGAVLAGWLLANSANLAKKLRSAAASGVHGGLRGMHSVGSAMRLHRGSPTPAPRAPPPQDEAV